MFPSPTITAPTPLYAADVYYDSEESNEFKQLFISLHSFKPSETKTSRDSEVFTPVSRAGSGFSDSDSEEESDIFAPYREDYDFEAHIPHSMLNTIRDMLDEPERLKDSSLNPNAKPFVPNSGTLHNQALEISPGPPLRPLQSSPPPLAYTYIPGLLQPSPSSSWTDIFANACLLPSTARTTLSDYARDLVHSRLWNRDALAELTQHFCWKAFCPQPSQESGPTLTSARAVSKDTLAPFAAEVHRQLHLANDEETASSFVWLLKESVLGTFKATWHASESPKAISYHLTPPDSFIESGIALVSFIGDLFRARLFDERQIALCLSILVNELVSLEHIAAISSLIKHAQALFWTYQPYKSEGQLLTSHPDPSFGAMRVVEKPRIKTFLDRFLASAAAVRDGHSVLCKKVVPGQREQMVREVVDLLVGWSKCEGFWDDSERISGMGRILANPCALTAGGGSKQAAVCVIEQAHTSNYLENLPPPPGLGVGHLSLGAAGTESGFDFDGSSSGFPAVDVVLYRSRTWPNGDFHSVRQSCTDVDKNTRVSGSGW